MQEILNIVLATEGTDALHARSGLAALADVDIPSTYRGVVVRAEDAAMFDGLDSRDKDPRKSLQLMDVPTPALGPGEALIVGDGERGQLQHRVDIDLRAGVHVQVPQEVRQEFGPGPQARPAVPRGRLRRGRCRAADRSRRHEMAARR